MSGGTLSNLTSSGSGYAFDFLVNPALLEIGLPAGAVSLGSTDNMLSSNTFVIAPAIAAGESLVLWYTFNDLNSSLVVEDFSGNQVNGIVNAGELVPGKFDKALLLNPGEHLSVNSDLHLTQTFTLSLWAKVLDDSFGVLARNGQFSLEYHTTTILSADPLVQMLVGEMPMPAYQAVGGCDSLCLMTDQMLACISTARLSLKSLIPDILIGGMEEIIIFT